MNHNYKLSRFFAWQSKQKSREGIAQYLLRYANVYELESGLMILSHSPQRVVVVNLFTHA